MRIVISGASGLIGTAISKALIDKGHLVVSLSRQKAPASPEPSPHMRHVRWDGLTVGGWTEHLGGADAVINLAGISLGAGRWNERRKREILESRTKPTALLVEAMRTVAMRPGLLINASGTSYYGNVPEGECDEEAQPGEDFLASVCVEWERCAQEAEKLGVRVVRLRTAFVISAEAPAFQKLVTPFRLFAGGWYGRGSQWFPWVHLQDVVGTYLHILEHRSISGPVNLAAPQALRTKDFNTILGQTMGRPAWMPVPGFALRIVLGEMADLLLLGQRVVPKKLLTSGFAFRYSRLPEALSQAIHATGHSGAHRGVIESAATPSSGIPDQGQDHHSR